MSTPLISAMQSVETAVEPAPQTEPRRWLDALLDRDSFFETDVARVHHATGFGAASERRAGDGVVAGLGRIDGRVVAVYAQDPGFMGGALGRVHADKICRVLDLAGEHGYPVVGLVASGGARIQEGVESLAGYGDIFRRTVALSGKVPQITVALGSCAGGAVYQPALTDVVIMVKERSRMFITGPTVIAAVTQERVTPEQLGGWRRHAGGSGLCALAAEDEAEAFAAVRVLLDYLRPNSPAAPSEAPLGADPGSTVPGDPRQTYDVRDTIASLADGGSFFELWRYYARNLVTGFARLGGIPVGIVANQPRTLGGVLDCEASRKGARFVRMCNAFGLPVVTLVDCPGYLPGVKQEEKGITVHGAKLLYAYCEATVPRLTVVTRKAYGGAFIVLGSRSIGASAVWAWPGAEIGVMGARGAVGILHRRELQSAGDPEATRAQLEADYRRRVLDPAEAAAKGAIDRIIAPRDTRTALITALSCLPARPAGLKAFPL